MLHGNDLQLVTNISRQLIGHIFKHEVARDLNTWHLTTGPTECPDMSVTNYKQCPDMSVTNYQQCPDMSVTNYQQCPDMSVTNYKQCPDMSVTN